MTVTETALYQRLGGCEAISDVVDELYVRVAADRYLTKIFDGSTSFVSAGCSPHSSRRRPAGRRRTAAAMCLPHTPRSPSPRR